MIDLPNFPHEPPGKEYSYEQVCFKRDVIAVYLICNRRWVYNGGDPSRTIWGFYNTKTRKYHAPINSSKVGDVVDIDSTTPYTSMQIKLSPLEAFFQ
jgi:hypothetical protein